MFMTSTMLEEEELTKKDTDLSIEPVRDAQMLTTSPSPTIRDEEFRDSSNTTAKIK